jgi:chromosome partitioning protein
LKDALAEALRQMRSAISESRPTTISSCSIARRRLSLLTLNGLCAADSVLIPMQCEYYALEGLSDLVQTIKKVRAHLNPRSRSKGLLRTMYDPRNTLALRTSRRSSRSISADKLFRTVVPRNVRLAEAPRMACPALHLDKTSKGAQATSRSPGEMLSRYERRGPPGTGGTPAGRR